jgi:hypothetical protein
MKQGLVCTALAVLLAACGGPSETDIQATVAAAVQGTATAEQVAVSVRATQAAGACEKDTLTTYADAVEKQIKAFEQQALLVSTTPRVSLGVPLQRLLDIQTETDKLTVPNCLKDLHARILRVMELHQVGYQNFAAQGSESVTTATLDTAAQGLASIKHDLKTVRDGTVPPEPTPIETPRP